ncbi:MAG: hypothetical protein KY393_07995 [Actinobacteria bacterium]|nr:hypothetical protein [Actinomycetota bacterium]
MDLELTESVAVLGDGTVELTLEVSDAEAFGFQAEIEQAEALGRRITLTYDEEGLVLPDPEQAFAFFGTPDALHMADVALKGHLIQPVLPASEYHEGQQINSEAVLPAGWSRYAHRLEATTTIGDSKQRQGVEVVNMASTQSADTELLLPSLDNPVDTIQGGEADLNEFFLATMLKVLVPPGTDPYSLLPDFPIQVGDAHLHDHAQRKRRAPRPRRPRRAGPTFLACAALLALSACASHPQFAGAATSIRLNGPIQFQHQSALHQSSGILVHSGIKASAELAGTTIQPNEETREDLGEQIWALTGVDLTLEASWTVEQILTSELPADSKEQEAASNWAFPNWAVPAGVSLLAALGIGLLVRRAKNKPPAAATDD